MKKIHFTLITLLLAACCLGSCKASSSKSQANADAKEAVQAAEELIVSPDSCIKENGKNLSCIIKVDYPTEPTELSQAVRKILNHELAKNSLIAMNGDESANPKPYGGDLANGNTVVKYYTESNYKYMEDQLKEIFGADPNANISMLYEISLSKQDETDTYITYTCNSYAYLGGAHGSTTFYSFNINKATGKVITQTIDTAQVKALQPLLRKGVLSYLTTQDPDTQYADSTLNDYLFIDNGIIPLPSHAPYLTKEGVHFIYQQYEIGPYAMGMVEFFIPYAEIEPYLTKEAQQINSQKKVKRETR